MNILEQEDIVKGLPDAALDSEMQQPSGQIPPFLILSEIHRRTEMRNNFAANEDDLSTPIVSQMLAASSASRQGLGTPMGQPSPMGQASPVPSMPSPSPAISAGGVPQGLGGMGVQLASGGGVVGMAEAGQFPQFYTGDPSDYEETIFPKWVGNRLDDARAPMRWGAGFYKWLAGKGIDASKTAGQQLANLYEEYALGHEVPTSVMEEYTKVSPELAYKTYTGRELDEPSVWSEAADKYRKDFTPERYPLMHMDPQARSQLPFGEWAAYGLGEGLKRNVDAVSAYVPAAASRVLDIGTAGLGGDPTVSPEEKRGEWAESVEEAVTGGRDAVAQQGRDLAQTFVGDLMESGQELLGADQAAAQARRAADSAKELIAAREGRQDRSGYSIDCDVTNEEIIEAATNQSLFEKTGIDLSEYEMDDQYFGEVVETEPAGFWETLKKDFSGALEKAHEWRDAGTPNPNTHHIPTATDPEVVTDIAQGVEETGSLKRDLLRQDGGFNTNQEFINSMAPYSASATGTETDTMGLLLDEFGVFEDAQGESAESLRSLIENNRAESKNRAFYLGMAALGAGIAKGEMGEGMENAVAIASDTLAKGESAVAPLEAASATEKSQSSKDRFEALVGLARADANFQAVQAQLAREGGLNARNYNTLKVAVMRAVQGILDSGYVEGTDTAAGAATVFNEMVNVMMGDVGSIEDAQTQFTTNPLTNNLQFTVPPA